MHMFTVCVPGAYGVQKRSLDLLEMELRCLWDTMWVLGTEHYFLCSRIYWWKAKMTSKIAPLIPFVPLQYAHFRSFIPVLMTKHEAWASSFINKKRTKSKQKKKKGKWKELVCSLKWPSPGCWAIRKFLVTISVLFTSWVSTSQCLDRRTFV